MKFEGGASCFFPRAATLRKWNRRHGQNMASATLPPPSRELGLQLLGSAPEPWKPQRLTLPDWPKVTPLILLALSRFSAPPAPAFDFTIRRQSRAEEITQGY